MRRKNALSFHRVHRSLQRLSFRLDNFSRKLEREKRRVTFIQMIDARRYAEFPQQPDSTDAEQHFLNNACLSITTIKMACYPAIGLDVFRNVRIQKI